MGLLLYVAELVLESLVVPTLCYLLFNETSWGQPTVFLSKMFY